MKAYQAGIAKFTETDSVVFGISTDDLETNKRFAKELGLEFALLSDETGEVAKRYGIYMPDRKMNSRATFVISKEGKIEHIEEGSGAIDIAGAASACSRMK